MSKGGRKYQDVMSAPLIFYVPDTHMQSDTYKSICQSIQTKLFFLFLVFIKDLSNKSLQMI